MNEGIPALVKELNALNIMELAGGFFDTAKSRYRLTTVEGLFAD